MWRLIELDESSAVEFMGMTFPRFRETLQRLEGCSAIGATFLGHPVGLVLAATPPLSRAAEVLSLFVSTNQRGQGLGTELLEAMGRRLGERGFHEIDLRFKSDKPSAPAVEKILSKLGWETRPGLLAYEARAAEVLTAPWFDLSIPEGWEIFPWGDLRNQERWRLLREAPDASWRKMGLHPFRDEEVLQEETSVGLRAGGNLIGWMITHRASESTLRYSAMYTRDEHQKMGRAVLLLRESLRRQVEIGVPFSSWLVSSKNEPMKRFVERRLKPYLLSRGEFRNAKKQLQPGSEAIAL